MHFLKVMKDEIVSYEFLGCRTNTKRSQRRHQVHRTRQSALDLCIFRKVLVNVRENRRKDK